MAQKTLTDGQCQEAVDAYATHGNHPAAAASLRIPEATFYNRYLRAKNLGFKPSKGVQDLENPKHLLAQIKELQTDLKKAQATEINHEIIQSKIIELKHGIATVTPPTWLLSKRAPSSSPGVPTLLCSDWHVGEVVTPSQIGGVNAYNMTIFRQRVRVLLDSTIKLLRIISPKMDYPGIVLPLGGDMVSGDIHEELRATNELRTMPTVLVLYGVLMWLIDELLQHFPAVFIPCVSGNHGRDTMKIWNKDRNATSFDWLLYSFLAKHYEGNPRVIFQIPNGPDAYYKVYQHRYLLTHLDQFRGGDGMIGALGPIIRGDHKKRSRNAQVGQEYDTLIGGHWHQLIQLTRLIVNGSLKGYCEYAYANNFPFEPPQQALWLTHPKYGITYRMPVYVETTQLNIAPTSWVSVPA
ncbi:MAG: hypothetical protein Q7R68_11060 [Nitrospirales bacterium]|nr:hypothetical protein [Nitrospirales bacterium]